MPGIRSGPCPEQFRNGMRKEIIKKSVLTVLKIIVSGALLWYLFASGRLSLEALGALFTLRNVPALALASLLFFASQVLSAVRLAILLKTVGYSLRVPSSFTLTMIGNFFNMVLPGVVGGDVLKGYYLARQEGEGKGRSSGIIVMDRVLGLLALSLIAGASILYLVRAYRSVLSRYADTLTLLLWVIAATTLLLAAVIIAASIPSLRRRLKEIASSIFKKSFFFYMADGFAKLAREKRIMLYASGFSLMIQLLCLLGLLALVPALNAQLPDPVVLMAISSIVMLVGTVPVTPGNIGWTELLASLGWSAVGSSLGGQVFLYWRIVTVLCSLPWGLYYLFSSDRFGIEDKGKV